MSLPEKEEYVLKKEGDLWVTEILGKRYGFRYWTWGEKNDASAKAIYMNPITNAFEYNSKVFDTELFVKTIFREEDGKFVSFTEQEALNTESRLADRLYRITQKMNVVSTIEARNL